MERRSIPMEELMPVLQLQMEQGGQAFLTVTGSSMLPMVTPHRDRVWLVPCPEQLRCGDVILYRRDNGQYVLHRIVRLSQPMICCGDNQWKAEAVRPDQAIALVTAFDRDGKHYTTHAWTYRLYVLMMTRLFFMRRAYIAVRRRLGRIRRYLQRK